MPWVQMLSVQTRVRRIQIEKKSYSISNHLFNGIFLSLVNKYQKAYVHESLQVLLFVLAIIKNRKIQHLRDDVDEIGR